MMKPRLLALGLLVMTLEISAQESNGVEVENLQTDSWHVFISSCLAEVWKEGGSEEENIIGVGTCLGCIHEVTAVGGLLSELGLPKAVACINQNMPKIFQKCGTVIGELEPGNLETGENLMVCMKKSFVEISADNCFHKSAAESVLDRLTDGTVCVLESQKNVTDFAAVIDQEREKAGGDSTAVGEASAALIVEELEKADQSYLNGLYSAVCHVADSRSGRSDGCESCFTEAGNRSAGVLSCGREFALPHFQDCLDRLEQVSQAEAQDKEGVFAVVMCFRRVYVRKLLEECETQEKVGDIQDLLDSVECANTKYESWAQENISPDLRGKVSRLPDLFAGAYQAWVRDQRG